MADVKQSRFGMYMPIGTPSFGNHTIDATNDGVGWGFQARTADAITHIGFRVGARTGSTTLTMVATLEGLAAATGLPDNSDKGGGSPTAANFNLPDDTSWDGTWQWVALTNAYTPSRGEFLAATIRTSDADISGANNVTIASHIANMVTGSSFAAPWAFRLTGGTWARQAIYPCFGLRTASGRYFYPAENIYNTRSAVTVGHRQALKFTLPAGSGDTFKIKGLRFAGSIATAGSKNPIAGLWDSSSLIQGVTLDSDFIASISASYQTYEYYFDESSLTALNFGTAYYLGLEVADAASAGVLINGLQLDSADDLDAYPGGSEFHFATYNGSAWSDDTTVRPFVEPIFDDITEPSGGGGGTVNLLRGKL